MFRSIPNAEPGIGRTLILGDYLLESPAEWSQAEIVMLSAFGDESHDQTKTRVFVVAGLLGNDKDWDGFRRQWEERIGDSIFHAADCESGHGNFEGMPESERLKLHLDLTQILAGSKLMGYGRAVDLAGCREVAPHVMKQFPDMPYYDCFVKT